MKLTWVGERQGDGRPVASLIYYGIPARDIADGELTPEQERFALASGLYKEAKPPKTGKDQ